MKKSALRPLRYAMVFCALAPWAGAQAFIDERSPEPEPAPVTTSAGVIDAQRPMPVTASASVAGVSGDVSSSAWSSAYPGPYGSMPLADALIAQIVPVTGKAISLNGAPSVISQHVTVPQGAATRLSTLQAMASAAGLSITINGEHVNVEQVGASAAASSGAGVNLPGTSPTPLPVAEPVKSWHIAKGDMLSSAMLEWAKQWGWELIWKAEVDYRIAADIHVSDTFLGGVGKVLEAYRTGNRPLWGDWNDAQKVLVIREPSNRAK